MRVGDIVKCELPHDELNQGALYTVKDYQKDIFGGSVVLVEYAVPNKRFNAERFRVITPEEGQ